VTNDDPGQANTAKCLQSVQLGHKALPLFKKQWLFNKRTALSKKWHQYFGRKYKVRRDGLLEFCVRYMGQHAIMQLALASGLGSLSAVLAVL